MQYELIQLPKPIFNYPDQMSDFEMDEYFEWFKNIKMSRLEYFRSRVGITGGFSHENLLIAYDFMEKNIFWQFRNYKDIDKELSLIPIHLKKGYEPKPKELIEPAISVGFDFGIFWGDFFISLDRSLNWKVDKNRGFLETGQLCISGGSSRVPFYPIWVIGSIQERLLDNDFDKAKFLKMSDFNFELLFPAKR